MATDAPPFWWEKPDWRARALWPVSKAYGAITSYRMRTAVRERVDMPVLCVGNFTVGGTGKTPVAIALARHAKKTGLKPGFLSRGHGGSTSQPHLVDPHDDSARHVGDEPLLLAEHAYTVVTPDRAAGARLLEKSGCNFVIMDDGFQSARIHLDYSLLVVDGRFGVGNGHVIPAGPLRAPLIDQLRHTTAILKVGREEAGDVVVRLAARAGRPVFHARTRIRKPDRFARRQFLAFAGIGHPLKFFESIEQAGGVVKIARPFSDHHFYSGEELSELATAAETEGLELVTTSKDAVRLRQGAAPKSFVEKLNLLEIDAVFEVDNVPARIIEETVEAWRRRRV